MNTGILSLLVHNHFGVLTKVSGLFGRRGYNIKALSVGETENPQISRITIFMEGDAMRFEQIYNQVTKLEEVLAAQILPGENAVVCELALIKLRDKPDIQCDEILGLPDGGYVIRYVGLPGEISKLVEDVRKYGIIEMSRTGPTALEQSAKALKI